MNHLTMALFLTIAFARLGLYQLGDRFRDPCPERARRVLRPWARWSWSWLRLQVDSTGTAPAGPCVYVANHRTYLDIPVLAGLCEATFLSRGDVGAWPLVGAIARAIDVVFVARDDPGDRMRAARRLLRQARRTSVIVFPEGTTTGAPLPGPFEPGLFRLLHRLPVPIVPVTVRYSDRRAYWVDEIEMWDHLRERVLRPGRPLRAEVHFGEPLEATTAAGAEGLEAAARAAICRPIIEQGELASP